MPIFEYLCPAGHRTDHVHHWSDGERPRAVPCGACDNDASYTFAPPAATMGCKPPTSERPTIRERGGTAHDIRDRDFECEACGHRWWVVCDGDERPDGCPVCTGAFRELIRLPGGEWSNRTYGAQGGYFDRGLGEWVTSDRDRRAKAKAKGLVPVDGDWDADQMLREIHEQTDRHDAAYADYADRLDNDPSFASYRHARDRGDMPRAR